MSLEVSEMKHYSEGAQSASSKDETTTNFEVEESTCYERTKLLKGVSTETRPNMRRKRSRARLDGASSGSTRSGVSDYKAKSEAAHKAAKSAHKAVSSCRPAVAIAMSAIDEGQKRVDAAIDNCEKVHFSHAPHYLGIVNKCRNAMNRISERVDVAEKAIKLVDNYACNATDCGIRLSELAAISKTKKAAESWAEFCTKSAKLYKGDAYKATYAVLKATKAFWQEIKETLDMEASFKKSINQSDGPSSELSYILISMAFLLGCILWFFHFSIDTGVKPDWLLFLIGLFLFVGSAGATVIKILDAREESSDEKMINSALNEVEALLKDLGDYLTRKKLTPPPSDSSSDEGIKFENSGENPSNETDRN